MTFSGLTFEVLLTETHPSACLAGWVAARTVGREAVSSWTHRGKTDVSFPVNSKQDEVAITGKGRQVPFWMPTNILNLWLR